MKLVHFRRIQCCGKSVTLFCSNKFPQTGTQISGSVHLCGAVAIWGQLGGQIGSSTRLPLFVFFCFPSTALPRANPLLHASSTRPCSLTRSGFCCKRNMCTFVWPSSGIAWFCAAPMEYVVAHLVSLGPSGSQGGESPRIHRGARRRDLVCVCVCVQKKRCPEVANNSESAALATSPGGKGPLPWESWDVQRIEYAAAAQAAMQYAGDVLIARGRQWQCVYRAAGAGPWAPPRPRSAPRALASPPLRPMRSAWASPHGGQRASRGDRPQRFRTGLGRAGAERRTSAVAKS